jgi:hypothetical protein
MFRIHFAGMTAAIIASALGAPAQAQQAAPPPFATTKVTDNVYIFRYGNHQSMFVVTLPLALRTMPVAATVVGDQRMRALLAACDMAAESRRAATLDR